jgi:hypothetical protein
VSSWSRILGSGEIDVVTACPYFEGRFACQSAPTSSPPHAAAVWRAEGASGVFAFRDGKPVGYLMGALREVDEWGENALHQRSDPGL